MDSHQQAEITPVDEFSEYMRKRNRKELKRLGKLQILYGPVKNVFWLLIFYFTLPIREITIYLP